MLIGGDDLRGFSAADLFWLTGTACMLPAEAKRCFGRRPTRLFVASATPVAAEVAICCTGLSSLSSLPLLPTQISATVLEGLRRILFLPLEIFSVSSLNIFQSF